VKGGPRPLAGSSRSVWRSPSPPKEEAADVVGVAALDRLKWRAPPTYNKI
jgi:hypothetical protein